MNVPCVVIATFNLQLSIYFNEILVQIHMDSGIDDH